jgi:UDP-N-acetylmuramoyl-tripeptide--D-alanyl-D-alanine ligase
MNKPVSELYNYYLQCGSVVNTDSRRITPGALFFALKGPNFNGNTYADDALAKGAKYVVVDEAAYVKDERYILVEDGLVALQQLANYYRHLLNIPFLAIGGSNGKTTTKELVAAVLSRQYKTFATKGNLNNHIGVPLTLLSIPVDTEVAVIEMGANAEGEIDLLCKIAEPTHGVITNIGLDHLEGFGSIEGVARANSELYYHLLKSNGVVFVNSNEEHLGRMAARFQNPVRYPNQGDYYHCRLLPAEFFVKVEAENGAVINTQMIGAYNFNNIATALCIGKFMNVPAAKAHQAVEEYVPSNNRSQLVRTERNTILLDAYNANPSSMKVAIENLANVKAESKAVILGDMLEMGKESEQEHRNLGRLLAANSLDKVLLCGKEMYYAHQEVPGSRHFAKKEDLVAWLNANPVEGACILVKGSRGSSLETLLTHL